MTNKLKLWAGILVVLVLMGLLTLLFNQRQHSVSSASATVQAPSSLVASSYGGVVVDQFVNDGQAVKAGDKLFTVNSGTLQQDVARGAKPSSTPAFDIDTAQGLVTYRAVTDGYVTDLKGVKGTFITDASPLATVVASGNRSVVATYRLAPADYARIYEGAPVEVLLPNSHKLAGTVAGVNVRTEAGDAVTDVTVKCDGLNDAGLGILASRGTPVLAVMTLHDDGPLAGPTQAFLSFLTKIGLR